MKTTELRIGNYIMANGKQINVGHIQDNFYGILINGNGVDTEIYAPIPLNEEWLLKFGFTEEVGNVFHVDDWFFVLKKLKGNFIFPAFWHVKIRYVHQLQNLYFALTGKELTCD